MSRKFLILISVLFSFSAFAENINITFQNIKSRVESKSMKIAAARLVVEAAREREGSLARSFLPSVDLYAGQESFKTGTLSRKTQPVYGAEARFNLFNGGKDNIEDKMISLETKKREYQAQTTVSEELQRARSLYWSILYMQERLELLRATLDINKQNLKSAKRRIKGGVATNSDRFEFEMKEVDIKREVIESEVQLASQIKLFKFLLGLDKGVTLSFSEALSHDHEYESVIEHTMHQHEFLFKENEIQAEQYSLLAKKKQRNWWPKLDAFVAYHHYNEGIESAGPGTPDEERKETILGLRLSMSIPSIFESNREATALSKEAQASQELVEYKKQEIEAHLQGEMVELKLLHDQVHEAEQNISRAKRYYKMTKSEYSRGVKNSPDVLGASEKLFSMKHKRLEIIKNFQISKAHVLSKIGR